MNKKLKIAKTYSEKKRIIEYYRFEKLKFKKELNRKENRNYHIDLNNPEEIKKYLEYNKKIHLDGLKSNIIITIFMFLLSIHFSNIILYTILAFEFVSALINFECINLQNYNLCRLEDDKVKKILKKVSEKRIENINKNMTEGLKVIGKCFENTNDIPSIDDIINNITTREEAKEILEYAKKQLKIVHKVKERKKVL